MIRDFCICICLSLATAAIPLRAANRPHAGAESSSACWHEAYEFL